MYFESDVYLMFLAIIVLSLAMFSLTFYPILSYHCVKGVTKQLVNSLL
jgi:hypothetical protein